MQAKHLLLGALFTIFGVLLIWFYTYLRRVARQSQSWMERSKGAPHFPVSEPPSVSLSIIIPAYNEEKRLRPTLEKISRYLLSSSQPRSTEVIVVDDGSRDSTSDLATQVGKELALNLRVIKVTPNQGKGNAIREGMLQSRGELLLMCDADGAHEISDVEKLIAHLPQDQSPDIVPCVVIGTRSATDGSVKRTLLRRLFALGFHLWVTLFCVKGIRDTQNGFKLFTRAAARFLFPNQHLSRWAFDIELLYLSQRKFKIPIFQEQVSFTDVEGSKVDLLSASLTMARDTFLVWCLYSFKLWRTSTYTHRPN